MKHISLGGLDVSRIGLGTMAMSGYYLDPDSSDVESIRAIQRALELGSPTSTPPRSTVPTPTRNSSAAR
jgi:aryl-alcohol dehydrogenase-like predicted oxidoreductase